MAVVILKTVPFVTFSMSYAMEKNSIFFFFYKEPGVSGHPLDICSQACVVLNGQNYAAITFDKTALV